MRTSDIHKKLQKLGSKERAQISQRFFKTGPGEYGEGDMFLGIKASDLRQLAKECQGIPLDEVRKLLESSIHEERLLALLILIRKFSKGDESARKRIYELYMHNTRYINNWDLVDISASHIIGSFLHDKNKEPLYHLARSNSLWERRISILSTFHYIRRDEFSHALKISKMLLSDKEDLIHKAMGWMLSEIGKRHQQSEEEFLKKHYDKIPRTMLRYAIERFPESKRKRYLRGEI